MQMMQGIPGFTPGSWGNQPGAGAPNFAAGLQQYQQGPGGNPFMDRLRAALAQNPQLAQLFRGGQMGQVGIDRPAQFVPPASAMPTSQLTAAGQTPPVGQMPAGMMGATPGGVTGPANAPPNLAGGLAAYLRR
jgi:hypothetical protein